MSTNPTGFDTGPIRKSGRYDNEAEILKKIDEANKKAVKFRTEAEEWDRKADALRGKPESAGFLLEFRTNAKKLRESAAYQETHRLKFLADKLSVLRTGILPGVGIDKSIPKQGSDLFLLRSAKKQ